MAVQIKGLRQQERELRRASRKVGRAEASAVRRVSTTIRKNASKAVREHVYLKAREAKRQIKIRRKPTAAQPQVTIEIADRHVSMMEYGARETRRGVTVREWREDGRELVGPTSFIGTSPRGREQVWTRIDLADKHRPRIGVHAGELRQPLELHWGASVYDVFVMRDDVRKAMDATWRERLPIELDRSVHRVLQRLS